MSYYQYDIICQTYNIFIYMDIIHMCAQLRVVNKIVSCMLRHNMFDIFAYM